MSARTVKSHTSRRGHSVRILLGTLLAAGLIVPSALANKTDVTINANVLPFTILRLETNGDVIVSDDDMDQAPGNPFTGNEVLDFGDVDPLGYNAGSFSGANVTSGSLTSHMLVQGNIQPVPTAPVDSNTDGAIYHVDGGYQLRALRNDGGTNMDVTVEVDGATALPALVSLNGVNSYTLGAPLEDTNSIRQVDVDPTELVNDMDLNTPQPLDLGIFVPLNLVVSGASTATSTVITFWGD